MLSPGFKLSLAAILMSGACSAAMAGPETGRWQFQGIAGDVTAADEAAEDQAGGAWLGSADDEDSFRILRFTAAPAPAPAVSAATPTATVTNGSGVTVGVVDTGILLSHSEFTGRVATGTCFGTCPGLAAKGNDDNGHGTHVAGIIGAAANGVGNTGVAPGARLMPVKVLDASGSGSYTAVGQGIAWAAANGAKVINMSLGGGSASSTLLTPLKQAAVTSVIVAAAGNSGNALSPSYPAAYATQAGIVGSMLIVGSVNSRNVISTFSQTPGSGGCVVVSGKSTCFRDVFLVAPGENIMSTYNNGGYAIMSGTSMATPYVSGVAARVLSASPFLTNKQVVSILLTSATDLGAKGTDAIYGRGLVNLTAALAPLGAKSVATAGVSTAAYTGTGDVGGAALGGVLGVAVRGSATARSITFFDAFGRDYTTDLTGAVADGRMSLAGLLAGGNKASFLSVAQQGYAVQGFVSTDEPNQVASAGFAQRDVTRIDDMVVQARFSDTTTFTMGHNAGAGRWLNSTDLDAGSTYSGLFMSASALNSPFLSLTDGGDFMAASFAADRNLSFSVAHASTADTSQDMLADGNLSVEDSLTLVRDSSHVREASNSVAAMNWAFAPWGTLGATASFTSETNGLLGSQESGALAITGSAETVSTGVSARFALDSNWTVTAAYGRGMTRATPVAGSLIESFSEIESQSYGIAIARKGIFGAHDSIGFAMSRPLHITSGTAIMHASTGVTEDRDIVYSTEVLDLSSTTPETDIEVGYTTRLDDSTTLQANAMVQQDVGGVAGETAVAGFVTVTTSW